MLTLTIVSITNEFLSTVARVLMLYTHISRNVRSPSQYAAFAEGGVFGVPKQTAVAAMKAHHCVSRVLHARFSHNH
jgi:hypothetical protein